MAFNEGAPQKVPDFVKNFGVNFPVGFAPREQVQEYLQHDPGKPSYVPELMFIDRHRQVRFQHSGAEDFFKEQDKNIRAIVESLLKEPATARKAANSARKKRS